MSAFKDILDTIQSIDGEMIQYILHGKRQRSLSKSAQEGILNFPVLISDSLTIEELNDPPKMVHRSTKKGIYKP